VMKSLKLGLPFAGISARTYRPRQSWQVSGLHDVDVELTRPILVAFYLKGVTR
jgi:hypothetical protein